MFKVGDIVEGKLSASDEYSLTTAGGEYLVEEAFKYTIVIRILKNTSGRCIGNTYKVVSKHFQLINVDLINE